MKIIDWFKQSNRYKHFLYGAAIGLLPNSFYNAMLLSVGVASALEYKDKTWGGKWDWCDWWLTVVGGMLGYTTQVAIIFGLEVLV